ncbi:hypothetical protein R3P38DRAFT_3270782 [Favolaschia claudopus]|uniref:Uncharacterized protein n=1 Tax=Favolaschia claudopus TaxID=2862362 RepID=A0AAW0BC88_9AGAR
MSSSSSQPPLSNAYAFHYDPPFSRHVQIPATMAPSQPLSPPPSIRLAFSSSPTCTHLTSTVESRTLPLPPLLPFPPRTYLSSHIVFSRRFLFASISALSALPLSTRLTYIDPSHPTSSLRHAPFVYLTHPYTPFFVTTVSLRIYTPALLHPSLMYVLLGLPRLTNVVLLPFEDRRHQRPRHMYCGLQALHVSAQDTILPPPSISQVPPPSRSLSRLSWSSFACPPSHSPLPFLLALSSLATPLPSPSSPCLFPPSALPPFPHSPPSSPSPTPSIPNTFITVIVIGIFIFIKHASYIVRSSARHSRPPFTFPCSLDVPLPSNVCSIAHASPLFPGPFFFTSIRPVRLNRVHLQLVYIANRLASFTRVEVEIFLGQPQLYERHRRILHQMLLVFWYPGIAQAMSEACPSPPSPA